MGEGGGLAGFRLASYRSSGVFEGGVAGGRLALDAAEDDHGHGGDDDRHAKNFRRDEALTKDEDAEDYSDDGVDKGVGGDLGDGDVLQQVGEAGEADDGPEDAEVCDGEDAGAGPGGVAETAAGEGDNGVDEAGGAELVAGGDEDVDLKGKATAEHSADGKRECGEEQDGVREEVGFTGGSGAVERGRDEGDYAERAEKEAGPTAPGKGFAVRESGFNGGDHHGGGGDDEGSEAARHHGFGPGEKDVVDRHEENADEREAPYGGGGNAQGGAADEANADEDGRGKKRAAGTDERRRQVLAGDADGGVGGTPEKVHQAEGEQDAGCRAGLRAGRRR